MIKKIEKFGLPFETYNTLSEEAKKLYTELYDYCTYATDPQYKTFHWYRNEISKLEERDREILIEYFNSDPAINWPGISSKPWDYYEKPY